MKRKDVVENNIKSGNVIVGLASFGKSSYEKQYNGGMGSNGLTSARHDVFSNVYRKKYPETYDENLPEDLIYSGKEEELHNYLQSLNLLTHLLILMMF